MKRSSGLLALIAFIVAALPSASADVVLGRAQGAGVLTNLTTPVASANLSLAEVSGTAPAPFNLTTGINADGTASGNLGAVLGFLVGIDTATLTSTAASNVDGGPGARFAAGSSLIQRLSNFEVLSALPSPLLSISATTINANASVTGDFGSLTATGSTLFENLTISVLGTTIQGALTGSASPNTALLTGVAGLSIFLNEQILAGDGITSRGITVNGIRINFNGVAIAGGGVLNGDIVIGRAQASLNAREGMAAVPEPSSLALMGLGGTTLAGCGWARRRRRTVATEG